MQKHYTIITLLVSLLLIHCHRIIAADTCLSIPNYTASSGTIQNCPSNYTLPGLSSLKVYYNGDTVIIPSSVPATTSGQLLTNEGKLGDVRVGQLSNMNIGTTVNTSDFSVGVFVKYRNTIVVSGQVVSIATFNIAAKSNITIGYTTNPSDSSKLRVLVTIFSSGKSVTTTSYFCGNNVNELSNWNHVLVTREKNYLKIYVNGVQQVVSYSGDTSVLSSQIGSIQSTGATFGDNDINSLVDELAIFSSSLKESERTSLFRVYDSKCGGWQRANGAPVPSVDAKWDNGITITVTFVKNPVYPVFYRLDSTSSNQLNCINTTIGSDQIVQSSGVSWEVTDSSCTRTYTLKQSLSQIYSTGLANNNWNVAPTPNGKKIQHTLQLYATYSINKLDEEICQVVSFPYTVVFETVLVAYSNTQFKSVDNEISIAVNRVYLNSNNELSVQLVMTSALPGANFREITLRKINAATELEGSVVTCLAPSGTTVAQCNLRYTKDWTLLNGGNNDVSGLDYQLSMDMYENNVKTRTPSVTFGIDFTVPQDPDVINPETIFLDSNIYTNPNFTDESEGPLSLKSVVYLKSALSSQSPVIPTTLRLHMIQGYICCVPNTYTVPAYDSDADTGGCKTRTSLMTQWADFETRSSGITINQPASSASRQIGVGVDLSIVFDKTNTSIPSLCAILLQTEFISTTQRKIASVEQWLELRPVTMQFFDLEATKPEVTLSSNAAKAHHDCKNLMIVIMSILVAFLIM
jgi:hypothetical protein